jgi:hypothetical protein
MEVEVGSWRFGGGRRGLLIFVYVGVFTAFSIVNHGDVFFGLNDREDVLALGWLGAGAWRNRGGTGQGGA